MRLPHCSCLFLLSDVFCYAERLVMRDTFQRSRIVERNQITRTAVPAVPVVDGDAARCVLVHFIALFITIQHMQKKKKNWDICLFGPISAPSSLSFPATASSSLNANKLL